MSQTAEIREKVRAATLFDEFSDQELEAFIDLQDLERFPAGECIVRQDAEGDCMYLLVEGSARVIHHKDGRDVNLATLTGGDFFGELALVDSGPRSADVEAAEDCVLLKLTHGSISALAGVYPRAAFKFLIALGRILVNRLRSTNQRYVDSLLFPIIGKE